jgi:hypothetical protein
MPAVVVVVDMPAVVVVVDMPAVAVVDAASLRVILFGIRL